jgi:hypothetical protein
MAATEPDVLVVIGERQLTIDAARAAGFLGLFATATDRASYLAILRGLASATGLGDATLAVVTIGEQTFEPPTD